MVICNIETFRIVLDTWVFLSLAWSHAVGLDGKVTGLEFNPYIAAMAEKSCSDHGVENVENWLCPLWDGVNISRWLD